MNSHRSQVNRKKTKIRNNPEGNQSKNHKVGDRYMGD